MDRVNWGLKGAFGRMLSGMLVVSAMFAMVNCGGGDDGGGGGSSGGGGGGGATQFAYVANNNSNDVSMFGVDANGALTPKGVVPAGNHPHLITADPLGRFVYVANHDNDFLSGYTIDRNTGLLTPIAATLTVGNEVHAAAFNSSGSFMYVINGTGPSTIRAFSVNNDGTLTVVGAPLPAGTHGHNLNVDPSNKFVYVAAETSDEILAYAIQPNGSLTSVGSVPGSGGGPQAVVAVGSFAYAANRGGLVQNFSINTTTGALTPLAAQPTISAGTLTHSLATDTPNSNFLYAANINSNDVSAYRIDKTTGVLAAVTGSPFGTVGTNPEGITTSKAGFLYTANFASDNITRFTINSTTGELTQPQTFANAAGALGPISIVITNF